MMVLLEIKAPIAAPIIFFHSDTIGASYLDDKKLRPNQINWPLMIKWYVYVVRLTVLLVRSCADIL
jgi:hypothetical protein